MRPVREPYRPAAYAEQALISAILDGTYPVGVALPAERELALKLGVTRPTLREVLGRLARDGWVVIRHGRPTMVNDIWRHGGLGVISGVVRSAHALPPAFVDNLLELRLHIAPYYARLAVERSAEEVSALLSERGALANDPRAFAAYDWRLHYRLTVLSGNPIVTLILNGFEGFYERMASLYFRLPLAKEASRDFYEGLSGAASHADGAAAERVTRKAMEASIALWQEASARWRQAPQQAARARRPSLGGGE
jgi:GntR family negative regulator for fad regulon and positive regulator of fabA